MNDIHIGNTCTSCALLQSQCIQSLPLCIMREHASRNPRQSCRKHAFITCAEAVSVTHLGKKHYASQSCIVHFCKEAANGTLPDVSNRTELYRSRKKVCDTVTPYGTLVNRTTIGGNDPLAFQRPLPMLYETLRTSENYSSILRHRLSTNPSTAAEPWTILIYQDGVDPSDGLAKQHSRKTVVFYWSFLDLGPAALAHEQVWFTVTVARYNVVMEVPGEHATLTSMVLDQFVGDDGTNYFADGASFQLFDGSSVLIYARVNAILADEPALKEMIACNMV